MNRTCKRAESHLRRLTAVLVCSMVAIVAIQTTARSDPQRKVAFTRTTAMGGSCRPGWSGVTIEVDADQIKATKYVDLSFSIRGPLTLSSSDLQNLADLLARWSAVPSVGWSPLGWYCAWHISFQRKDGTFVSFDWLDSDSSVPSSALQIIKWMN